MTKNTRRIFVSILTLVLTVVAVGTTTFAWFTIGNVATVTGISGQVVGGEGLEMQLVRYVDGTPANDKATDFKNHLGADDWAIVRPADFKFKAVELNETTGVFTQLGVITGAVNHGKLHRGAATTANVEYIELTVNFRSLSAGTISLTNLTFNELTVSGFDAGVPYIGLDGNNIPSGTVTPDFDGSHALRVTFTGGASNNLTYRKDHAVNAQHGQWDFISQKGNEIYEDSTGAQKVASSPGYSGVAFTNVAGSENGVTVALTSTPDTDGFHTASLTMQIWVDGWDPHTFDAIYEMLLGLSLTFEKLA